MAGRGRSLCETNMDKRVRAGGAEVRQLDSDPPLAAFPWIQPTGDISNSQNAEAAFLMKSRLQPRGAQTKLLNS